jgi:hypothetical protein
MTDRGRLVAEASAHRTRTGHTLTYTMGNVECDDCSWPNPEVKRYSASRAFSGIEWDRAENPDHILTEAMVRAWKQIEHDIGAGIPVENMNIIVTVEVTQ